MTLTFRAAAWSGDKTTGGLTLSATGGATANPSTLDLASGTWTDYTITLSNVAPQTTLTFSAVQASKNRFFLDEVRVTQGGSDPTPPQPSAPTISVSPTSLSVAVGGNAQATITTNDAVTSVIASVGTISGNTWSWTPSTAGITTVTFTANGAAGTTPATATMTVTATSGGSGSGLPVPTIAQASNLLSSGNGFTANWSAVTGVTGYQVQVATNAQFDAVENVVLEEHFDTLTATARPDGWDGNLTSDLIYGSGYSGDAAPAYKLRSNNQWLESPSFQGGTSLSFFAKPNGGTGSSIAILETSVNGASTTTTTHDPISLENTGKIYSVLLTGNATKVKFTFTKSVNVGLDDIVIYGPPGNAVVKSASPSGASTSSYAFTGLSPHTTYYVRVRAQNGGQVSDWSATVEVTTATGNTNYAPKITSLSPTTATVAVGSTQAFSLGYKDDNPNDTLTLAVTDNGTSLSSETLSGISGTANYSYAAATPGPHTLGFTVRDAAGLSATTNATVTVPVPVPTLDPIDEETLLNDGTGFTVEWSGVAIATGYEMQIATNAMFDAVFETVATEDFSTLTATTPPNGWVSSAEKELQFNNNNNYTYGVESPSFKLQNGKTLTTPVFPDGISGLTFHTLTTSSAAISLLVTAKRNGSPVDSQTISIPSVTTYVTRTAHFSMDVDQVILEAQGGNIDLDDIVFHGAVSSSLVNTLIPAAGTTSTNVVDLVPNTTYYVRIRALYNTEASAWSDYVSAKTPASAPVPPEISSVAQASEIAAGGTAHITVTYSDANEDPLQLSLSIAGAAAQPLDLASGGVYDYTPTFAGIHRLIFSVTDGQFTTSSTNDIDVVLSAPVASDATGATSSPHGFTAHWTGVPLAEGYTVEVATNPLFDEAPGAVVFYEDFTTATDEAPPTAWTASADKELRYTSAARCGDKPPAFRFGTSGDTLESPTFPEARFVSFFGFTTAGSDNTVTVEGYNGNDLVKPESVALAEGKGNYSVEFSEPVTRLVFTYSKGSGYFGLDDVLVRTSAAENTVIATVAAAAGATSTAISQLPGSPTYYYRVRANGTGVSSEWSDTIEVPFLGTPKNIVFHSTKYVENGTSLTWDASIGAATYRVKMLEGTITPDVALIEEFFDDGTTAPSGWIFAGTLKPVSDEKKYCGESAPALNLTSEGASITTPVLEYMPQRVSFMASATGNSGGSLTVYALTNGTWQSVATLSPGKEARETFSYPLPANTTKVKIEFTEKMSGTNFAIDDLVIKGTGPVWHEYRTFDDITTPSLSFSDLHHDTPYSFTVSAINEYGEATAEPLIATTPPNNPVTLIRVR